MWNRRKRALAGFLAVAVVASFAAAETDDLLRRAQALSARGDWKGAVALLDRAVAADPGSAAAARERGRARMEIKDWTGSLQDFERAVALDPLDAEARFLLGWWYAADGKDKRATLELDRAVELDPKNASYLYQRGRAKERRNLLRAARVDYLKALALDPRHKDARDDLVSVDERLGIRTTEADIAAAAASAGAGVRPPAEEPASPVASAAKPAPAKAPGAHAPVPASVPGIEPIAEEPRPAAEGTPGAVAGSGPGISAAAGAALAAATITPAGGRLEVPGAAQIDFPAGAVDKAERFTIRHLIEPSKDVVLYAIERDGGRRPLARPARVRFTLPAGVDGTKAYVVQEIGGDWLGASHGAFDPATRTLSLEVTHFSPEGWMSEISGETLAKLEFVRRDAMVGGVVVVGAEILVGGVTAGPAGLALVVFAAHGWATGAERDLAEKLEGLEGPLPIGGFQIYWDPAKFNWKGTYARYKPDGTFVGFDEPRRDATGKLLKSAYEGSDTETRFIPQSILKLGSQLQDVARWYSLSAIGGRRPIVVRVHGKLDQSQGTTNLGEWDGRTLNVLDSLVVDAAASKDAAASYPMLTTIAHEYWHAIYGERRQGDSNPYVDPFPGFEEAAAVSFESLQVPEWEKFTDTFQWGDVARVLRSGLLVAGDEEDPVKRGYDLWPFAKYVFHREGGGKTIDAFARGAVKDDDVDKMFTHLVHSMLTVKDALPAKENVRLPYASTGVPTHESFTGWSKLSLSELLEPGKTLALGSSPWPAARPLSLRVGLVRVAPRDPRVPGGPLLLRRRIPVPVIETLVAWKPVSAPKEWRPANTRDDLQWSLTGLVIPKDQVDAGQVLLPFAIVGGSNADPDFESPLVVYRLVPPIVKSIGLATDPDSGERGLKVVFEPIPPGKDLDPWGCLAGYRLVGRKAGASELTTLAEILYTTDHLSDGERSSWYESKAAKKVQIEPASTIVMLPADTATGYPEVGLQAIEGRLKPKGQPLLSEPAFAAPPACRVTVFVGKTFDEMGRPASNPFQTETDPVPGADVTWNYTFGGKTVQGQVQADTGGSAKIEGVPLDTPVAITSRGETKSATCTVQRPSAHVNFGWEGRKIKPAGMK